MREGQYGVGSRQRSPSPRRPLLKSRDFGRHCKFSPYNRHEREEYSRVAKALQGIDKMDYLGQDSSLREPRFSGYDYRDGDWYVVNGGISNPRRMEKTDNFDRLARLSNCGDGAKSNYEDGVSIGRSKRSYDDDSYHSDTSSLKLRHDPLLDGPKKSDYLSVKDYILACDSTGVGGTEINRSGERDYYPQNNSSDSGRAGLFAIPQYLDSAKPAPLECRSGGRMCSRQYTLALGGVVDTPMSNLSGGDGSGCMASRYLNTDTDKQRYSHTQAELHLERGDRLHDREDNFEKRTGGFYSHDRFVGVEKMVEREIYKFKKEDDFLSPRSYTKGDSDYFTLPSQLKDYDPVPSEILRVDFPGCSVTRELHMSSDMIRPESRLASKPTSFDAYIGKRQNMFPGGTGGQLDDTRSSPNLNIRLPEGRQGDCSSAEFGISNIDGMSTMPNDGKEGYRNQHLSRNDVSTHAVDEFSHKEYMGDDGLWEQFTSSQVQLTPENFDTRETLHAKLQDLDMLGIGSSRVNPIRGYYGYKGFKPEERRADVAGRQWSHFKMTDLMQSRTHGPSFGRLNDSPRRRLPVPNSVLVEPSVRRLRDRHVMDEILYENDIGIRISTDENGLRMIYNQVDLEDDIELVHFSERPRSSSSDYGKTFRVSREMANDQPSASMFHPRHSVKPHKYDFRDIKKRLGPIRQKLHVSQRNKYKPSIKKRLAPAQPKNHAAFQWLKTMSSKVMVSNQNDSDGGPHDQGVNLEDDHPLAKPEPPEKSDDFKQLVKSAFFKFLKQVNETPMKRKKYMEQGKAGTLKCIVCGSNSDEFVGTETLAMHAFTSKKVGLRSQHLGLHTALCALMGWKVAEEPSSEWHCEVMNNAEALALKEDLIIWPPVVIVHNRTIENTSPDERVIISTERLDTKLRDMGFGSILKVCNGKPANQSMMVVKFSGTLSGLREAERLHQMYIEYSHGRAEGKQLKNSENISYREGMSTKREVNFLYGHLGTAGDFDKLDFDTKKRCVLRSKKQILSIADAPVGTD